MININFKNHEFVRINLDIYLANDGKFYQCKKCSGYLKYYEGNSYYAFGNLYNMKYKYLLDYNVENINKELLCDEYIIKNIIE